MSQNEDIKKILVHEHNRKGSIQTAQEAETYFNFVKHFVPPVFVEEGLTPEEFEKIRKREARMDRLHRNYLKRKATASRKNTRNAPKPRKPPEERPKDFYNSSGISS